MNKQPPGPGYNWVVTLLVSGLSFCSIVIAQLLLSGCVHHEAKSNPNSQNETNVFEMQDRIKRLRLELDTALEELRILTNALANLVTPGIRMKAEAARNEVNPEEQKMKD